LDKFIDEFIAVEEVQQFKKLMSKEWNLVFYLWVVSLAWSAYSTILLKQYVYYIKKDMLKIHL
jgi:hypothetical protein